MEIGKFKLAKADLVRPPNKPAQEQIIPKQKPYTEKVFKLEVDDFIKGFIGGFPKDEMLLKIQSVLDKAVDAGAIEPQEGIKYLRERKQQLVDFARENYGQELPGIEDRENFYAGSSLEQFGSKIKDLHLKGTSSPKINELLGFEKDRSSTIDSFIQSMKEGKSPIKITVDELSKRPNIKGTNISGKPGQRKEDLKKYVENYKSKNKKLPSVSELRKAGFDYYSTVIPAIDSGEIKVASSTEALSAAQSAKGKKDILSLSKDPEIRKIFRDGKFDTVKTINRVKKVLGNADMSDDIAGGKIHSLAKYFSGELKMEGIKPVFKKTANLIEEKFPYKRDLRDVRELQIGESVGQPSIKGTKGVIREADVYKDLGITKTAAIDEVGSVAGSVKQGSTPYGNFAQIVNKDLNSQDKRRYDSIKSRNEAEVKAAIENARANGIDPKDSKAVKKAVNKYNANAVKYERLFNRGTRAGDKKFNLFKISLDEPSKTISRYNNLPESFQNAFNDVYKNNGYSFKVPRNVKTIQEIKDDVVTNPNKFAKNVGRAKAPRLYAEFVPGFGDLMEGIGEDFKQGKYGKAGFKSLGALSIPVVGYFAQDEFRKGEPILDIASSAITGIKPIQSLAKSFVPEEAGGFSDKEKLARAQLKLLENIPTSSLDMSPVLSLSQKDPDYTGSPAGYIDYLKSKKEGIESIALPAEKRFQEQIIEPFLKKKALERGSFMQNIKSLIPNVGPIDPNMQLAFQTGGRVGYADGPEDPSKRKFMKVGAGLASLPIVGKFFKPAVKVAPAVVESAKGIPDFIFDLVAKVKARAVEKGMKYFTGNKADEFEHVYKADDFIVKEKGNKITLREIDDPDRPGYRENQIEIDVDPETGKMTYKEASVRPDDEGKLKDVEEFIDDIDLENMKKIHL
jgi:hypothetical protein